MPITVLVIGDGKLPEDALKKYGYDYEVLPHTEEDNILLSRKSGKCRASATAVGIDFSNSVVPTFGIIKNKEWVGMKPRPFHKKYTTMDKENAKWAKKFWAIADGLSEDVRVRAVRLKLTKI